ncbi:mediator of RNA polymerase II transcription subunit 18 [Scaptodrosophila lebanonensis]|uniref:Mediator of RNA polymerase II transcription subunit 18 n=1 Tax=Drosophila lebanonensis TaxID=7225 RepID=A0A6J2TXL7_DROLE|nr:mediator of RNA polymerase II transcription subunit 18 [Scaptodrosophila lebanonensis]
MSTVASARESLSHALQNRFLPNLEFLLQGSILDSAVEHLMHRLKGLCDNVDTSPETFHDLEVCMSLRQPNQNAPLTLRVRRALDRDAPFQMRYLGQPEVDQRKPTLVRSCMDCACTNGILEFLTEMGFRLDFEYIAKGFMFRKGRMKITVSKLIKIIPGKQQDNDPISQSYIVELSVVAPNGQESVGEEMRVFADQLKPLVQLEKIDYKRLP